MIEKLKNVAFIFPVMLYYAIEALIVALFISFIWNTILFNRFGYIKYMECVSIYWILKMILFDVFKLIASFNDIGKKMERESDKYYNEQFEE